MRSTFVERTLRSAEAHLMGMIPYGQGFDVTSEDDAYLLPPFKGATSSYKNESALANAYRAIPVLTSNQTSDFVMMPDFNFGHYCPDKKAVLEQEYNSLMMRMNA